MQFLGLSCFMLFAIMAGESGLTGPGLTTPTLPVVGRPHLMDLVDRYPEWEPRLRIGIRKSKEMRAWLIKVGRGEADIDDKMDTKNLELSDSDESHPIDHLDPDQAELQLKLIRAARAGDDAQIAMLIEAGAVPDVPDPETRGRTPLHLATLRKSVPSIRALVDRGAPLSARADEGRSPLHFAVDRHFDGEGHDADPASYAAAKEAVRALIELGADINMRDDCGKTALHLAAGNGLVGICELLISRCVVKGERAATCNRLQRDNDRARDSKTRAVHDGPDKYSIMRKRREGK
jgi:hypothetical protein